MFESVIVPLDGKPASERALGTATTIAAAVGCPILLMTVVPDGSAVDDRWLTDLADDVSLAGVRHLVFEHRDVADGILDLQAKRPGSLVCMATSGHTGLGELVLGSVAAEVIRGMTHSLVVVGPSANRPADLKRIVVCLDGSALTEEAARTAGVWATLLRAELHLVRVAPPSTAGNPHDQFADLARVAGHLRASLGVHATWEVLHADRPADALVTYARELPASLVAMTTHGATGAFERLMGSTAMRVVHDVPCPVLLVPR